MQVYIEFALLENFCMDFCLLYATKILTRNAVRTTKLILPSLIGGAFAVVFPLLGLQGLLSLVAKFAYGGIICLTVYNFSSAKSYFKFYLIFILLTFLLGGAIFAVFTFADVKYSAGHGYLLSSVPIGVPFFLLLMLITCCRAVVKKYKPKATTARFDVKLKVGKNIITGQGFFDSGNDVYYKGCPVVVISKSCIKKYNLLDGIKRSVKIHTVAGSKLLPVFFADEMFIETDEKSKRFTSIAVAVTDGANGVIIHPDFMGEFI